MLERWRLYGIGWAVLALLAAGGSGIHEAAATVLQPAAPVAPYACPQFFPGGVAPSLVNPKLAPRTTLLCNDAYAVMASGISHGPLWSAEHPTAASIAAARRLRRDGEFAADDRLPAADRAQLSDYRNSGYDRGHMSPSGDMPDPEAQGQSFLLSNMVPQRAELNRGIWEGVEEAVRDLAQRQGELFLVTGPAFRGRSLKRIGGDGVLVPSSTWKAVYDPRAGGTGVYVCKNNTRPTCKVLSVAALIRVVGIDPFPFLPDSLKQVAMVLPTPDPSPYEPRARRRRGHKPQSWLDWLLQG
ncbi:DNA/RNA non-specific endonuclease [Rhizosaccharibacter radicis]|uniref:Endonuclease n=1 Tax=Rhizosaccharibacter radicis TaxID=2782605 RepID=A0ABT1VU95_9PROT|nr:DNA/RNA non-specific endonuclease [Acetobacteraceae bacterium KSS12]